MKKNKTVTGIGTEQTKILSMVSMGKFSAPLF
jgi:hypothetical protein